MLLTIALNSSLTYNIQKKIASCLILSRSLNPIPAQQHSKENSKLWCLWWGVGRGWYAIQHSKENSKGRGLWPSSASQECRQHSKENSKYHIPALIQHWPPRVDNIQKKIARCNSKLYTKYFANLLNNIQKKIARSENMLTWTCTHLPDNIQKKIARHFLRLQLP